VPGVDVPYEEALDPEVVVDTEGEAVPAAVSRVVELAHRLAEGTAGAAASREAWVIWITGRPGSGKSTLAQGVAAGLQGMGVPVRLLSYLEVAEALGDGHRTAPFVQEIAHRALAYAATQLAEAGVPVIIDATAPRRAWRELARSLAKCFAEVQLVCPPEVCGDRERASRWHLAGGPVTAAAPAREPDVVIDYEESIHPDLVLHTHVQGHWSAVEQVLRLARRLPGAPATAGERSSPCSTSES
jgi:adenylylsulfate kinase